VEQKGKREGNRRGKNKDRGLHLQAICTSLKRTKISKKSFVTYLQWEWYILNQIYSVGLANEQRISFHSSDH
jgi:hypothetical protein